MAVIELSEPSAAATQLNTYNSNVGGQFNLRTTFPGVPSATAWAVIGCVFTPDPVTPAMITGTLIPGLEGLAGVTSVNGDQLLGQVPATIEAVDHEPILHVSSSVVEVIGAGDSFDQVSRSHETQSVPLGKWWAVVILRLPAALDAAGITALETAVGGIAGVDVCEHLIDGVVSPRASDASVTAAAHLRIDPVEV